MPTAGTARRAPKELPPRLAVLKWCFYELLLARQAVEIAERAGGARLAVGLADVKAKVEAQLAQQQLEPGAGGVQLSHFVQLASVVPALVSLRWTTTQGASPVIDLVVATRQSAPARLRAAEKALAALAKTATAAAKRGRPRGSGPPDEAALDAAVKAALPPPAAIPPKPGGDAQTAARPDRDGGGASPGSDAGEPSDGLGSHRRLLSPDQVAALPVRHPRGEDLLNFLQQQPWYTGQAVASVSRPARPARYADLRRGEAALPPPLWAGLRSQGIQRLYSHQAKAVDAALDGKNVVLSTATASGKSLAYVLPIIATAVEGVQQEPPAGCAAICMFPTKALAHDQLRALTALLGSGDGSMRDAVRPTAFDGDTPHAERAGLRQRCNVFLTNPDMLHASILPAHKQWSEVLRVLRYIVLDEMHVYTGIYGAHVALILRRLLRVCSLYNDGAPPRFICCSATLARPRAHFERLIPRPFSEDTQVVSADMDGAPAGKRWVVLWQPPIRGGSVSSKPKVTAVAQASEEGQQDTSEVTAVAVVPAEAAGGTSAAVASAAATPAPASGALDFGRALAGTESCLRPKTSAAGSGLGNGSQQVTLQGAVLSGPTPPSPLRPTRTRRRTNGAAAAGGSKRAKLHAGDAASEPASEQSQVPSEAAAPSDLAELPRRCSPNIEAACVLGAILTTGCRALCFTKVRRMCEILKDYTTRVLLDSGGSGGARGGGWEAVASRVGTYRGGYTAEDRRAIEASLQRTGGGSNSLQGVVCTNALELGVDIGQLDAVVCLGYPGCSSSLWQQVGRAGRSADTPSLAVVIAYDSPVDAFFLRHPDRLLEHQSTDLDAAASSARAGTGSGSGSDALPDEHLNPYLLQSHALCAAVELPLRLAPANESGSTAAQFGCAAMDAALFGGAAALRTAVTSRPFGGGSGGLAELDPSQECFYRMPSSSGAEEELWRANPSLWSGSGLRSPHAAVSIRAVGSTFAVMCTRTERELETVESSKAFFSLYEGSLYQHQSAVYRVVEVRPEQRLAYAAPVDGPRPNYITQPVHSQTLSVCKREARRNFSGEVELHFGQVLVSVQVSGFMKCHKRTFEPFHKVPLHGLPPMETVTTATWFRLGNVAELHAHAAAETLEGTSARASRGHVFDFAAGLHAANHALRSAAAVLLDCDAADICCEHESKELRLLLHDAAAGGTGLCAQLFAQAPALLDAAVELLRECGCTNGCPSCVLTTQDTGSCYNEGVCKRSGLQVLLALQRRVK